MDLLYSLKNDLKKANEQEQTDVSQEISEKINRLTKDIDAKPIEFFQLYKKGGRLFVLIMKPSSLSRYEREAQERHFLDMLPILNLKIGSDKDERFTLVEKNQSCSENTLVTVFLKHQL